MGRVLTHDDSHVTFAVSESLRGQTETRLTFGYASITDKALASASNEFLVLSQGDDYWGKPAQVVSLGQKVKGQISYLGWIAFPLKTIQGKLSVDVVRTMVDHKGSILSLERAKTLIQEIPYGSKRGRVEQIVGPEPPPASFSSNWSGSIMARVERRWPGQL
jgi:hypothetical protein